MRSLVTILLLSFLAVPPASPARGEPAAAAAVLIPAEDGFPLHAMYHRGDDGAPAVLILHQCDRKNGATGFENIATGLAMRGFHVLLLDFRGYGRSRDDRFTGENWQEAQTHFAGDTAAAFRFLESRPGVSKERIAVAGASCGGRQAILLARDNPGIRALVLLSSGIGGRAEEAAAKLLALPMLCIAAEEDGTAAPSMQRLCGRSRNAASRLILEGGREHGTPLLRREPALEGTIIEFLGSMLKR